MAKILQVILVAALAIAVCDAGSIHFTQRNRFLARQEAADEAPAAVTPYPSASELKPEIPFEEETQPRAAVEPDQTYGPPDQTYGPPEIEALPESDADEEPQPEEFAPEQDEDYEENIQEPQAERLVSGRKKSLAFRKSSRAANLQAVPQQIVSQPQFIAQPVFFADRSFAYTAQFQSW